MKELDVNSFTVKLGDFYEQSIKSGTVLVTMKRMTELKIQKREKLTKKDTAGKKDVVMTEASDASTQYPCLVRASYKKNKISTIVPPDAFNKFQKMHGIVVRGYMDSLKKKERNRDKKKKTKALK